MPQITLKLGAWILSCVMPAVALVPDADSSRFCFFPVIQSDTNGFLGLSLVNTAGAVNEATVTWTNGDGNSARTGRLSLSPGAQRAFLVWEVLGIPNDPSDGWIRIDSSEPGLLSYLTSGTDGILDGTEPVSQPAATIFLDHVAVNTGFTELDHTDTFVILVNPGNAAANARAELISLGGRAAGSLAVSIPAGASRTIRISESFREVLPVNNLGGRTFNGYMKVVSDGGLACWLRIETPLSRRLLRGRALEEIVPASLAMAGHFASGSTNLYRSVLNLINTGDVPARLELLAQDDRGRSIGTIVRLTLGPGQGIRDDVLNLFHIVVPAVFPPPLITGYIRIRAADGSMVRSIGDIDIDSDGNTASMLYPITTAASRDWTMPFVINTQDYFTGYAIANPNELLTVQTDVTIEILDEEGRLAAPPRNISLSPSARTAGLVEKDIRSGYLRIRANGPVILLGSIGTCTGSALAFLPAFR